MATAGTYKGVEIQSGTDQQIADQIAQINQTGQVSNVKPTEPITPTDLQGEATPAKVTSPNPATIGANLEGQIQSQTDQYTKDLEARTAQAQTGEQQAFDQYMKSILSSEGETAKTAKLYAQEGGVNDIQKELDDINNQILQEQHALLRETQRIEDNKEGLFGGAVEQKIDEARRASLRKQADLSIIQQGIQGRFDSAKAIADRAVQAQLESQRIRNEALQLNYERNRDLFTKAEQREFEAKQADRERALNRQEKNLQDISDLSLNALQNGAPKEIAAQMRQAKTVEEAIKIGGQYIDAYDRQLKQLQISKLMGDMKASVTTPLTLAQSKGNIQQIDQVLKSSGLSSAVGPSFLARAPSGFWGSLGAVASVVGIPAFTNGVWQKSTGEHQNFIAGVEQLQSQLSLDSLIQAKAKGATFGALSDSELAILSKSATKLGSWAIKDDSGKVVGYNATEADMKQELDRINNFAKLDLLMKGGRLEDIGAKALPDGTIWVQNSDGSYTLLNDLGSIE